MKQAAAQRAAEKDDRTKWQRDFESIYQYFEGRLRWNTLKQKIEVLQDGIWDRVDWSDTNYMLTKLTGHAGWNLSDRGNYGILRGLARENQVNPVAEYLDRVGVEVEPQPEILNDLAYRIYGIEDPNQNEYLKFVLLGSVKRGMFPGESFRWIPILVGEQLKGKSESVEWLYGSEFFGSGLPTFGSKDGAIETQNYWGYELAEVDKLLKSTDSSVLKSFIARTKDIYRPPHGVEAIEVPRTTIFWGTTNHQDLFNDASGNTRYLVLQIPDGYNVKTNQRWVEANRDLIWSSAVDYWRTHTELPRINIAAQTEQNEDYFQGHPWEPAILECVKNASAPLTTSQILTRAIDMDLDKQQGSAIAAVRDIMTKNGYKSKRIRIPGTEARQYVWEQKGAVPSG
jgi:predicted P-loop ATPase